MALLFMDGFDGIPSGYSTASYLTQNFTVIGSAFGNVAGFQDGRALLMNYPGKNNTIQLSRTVPSGTNFIFGCRFQGPLSTEYGAPRINLGNLSIDLRYRHFISGVGSVNTIGVFNNGTLVARSDSYGNTNVWRHLEVKALNGAAVTVYLDNVLVATWNAPSLSATTTFSITFYSGSANSSFHDWYFDDMYLMNTAGSFANNLLGSSAKIKIKPPTTAGSANDITNYSGSSLINSIATVDGTYASSAVTDAKLLATIDEITDDIQILGARTLSYTQNTDSPTKNAQDIISIDGNLTTKGNVYTPLVGVYGLNIREQFVDPANSSQFTPERLAELQFGIQVK